MNNRHLNPRPPPPVGATFYPGGVDDFYMPEVISPAPQRVMPEVPENMQHNLAHLEQQAQRPAQYNHQYPARHDSQASSVYSPAPTQYHGGNRGYNESGAGQWNGAGAHAHGQQPSGQASWYESMEQPKFSPFPVLQNPPPNVPPTAEQKEASLEAARIPVLGSTDPSNQLDWGQDTLAYVEEAKQNEQRVTGQPSPRLSQVQQLLKDDAMKVIGFLADQQHPRALVLKGIWLEFGKFDHAIDKRQAWECYKLAVKSAFQLNVNDPASKWGARAQYRIGMQFENSKEITSALKYYQMGADAGDSAACYRLGMMVLMGQHGQMQDFRRGLSLISAAAQRADENAPQGAYVLGMLQAHELPQITVPEQFLPRDIPNAKMNIERAAFLGFAKAQTRMGSAYEVCELGCDFDPALSLHYNNLAARQGEVDAEMAISKWFLAGHEGVFEKDEEMAFKYAQRAAQDGLPTAQFAIGYFHEIGIYVPVDLRVAKEWYSRASSNGNNDAAGRVDGLSRSKTLSRKDHEKIAVSKIKESRLQTVTESAPPAQAMQAVVTMPDPTRLSLHSPPPGSSEAQGRQRRPSAAPYPGSSDLGPPGPGFSGHSSNLSNPEFRPGSAFGINPNLRSSSAATIAGSRPEQYSRPGLADQGRPYSNYVNPAARHGRGGRVASGPAAPHYPGPESGRPAIDRQHSPQPPPKVDIGFLAPLNASGSDSSRPSPNKNLNRPPGSRPAITPTSPQRPSSAMGNSSRPPRVDSVPPPQKPFPQPSQPPQQQQPPGSSASQPSSTGASRPGSSTHKEAAAPRPFGKGPKTFEAMGVPAGKSKDDCIVM